MSVSLFMGKLLGSPKAWDEEQLLRKKVPFLEPEPCKEAGFENGREPGTIGMNCSVCLGMCPF